MSLHKQTPQEPLFPDLMWNRPETKLHAGKLLIIGGNLHGFAAPANAYQAAIAAGVGSARVLLPSALQKTVGAVFDVAEFAPSTPSGSFASQSLGEVIATANWADATLVAGDVGRNAETAIVLAKLCDKYSGQLTITKDAVDHFYSQPRSLLDRPNTTIVLSLAQLQKMLTAAKYPKAPTLSMGLVHLADFLAELTTEFPCYIMTYHLEHIFVAVDSEVSATKVGPQETWRVTTAGKASVWLLQNPKKPFQALTTSLVLAS